MNYLEEEFLRCTIYNFWFFLINGLNQQKNLRVCIISHFFQCSPTHISLVLECKSTVRSKAVEVCCTLSIERARHCPTVLRRTKPLEALGHYGRVFTMIVSMHLNIWRADVHFITTTLLTQRKHIWNITNSKTC